MRKLVAFMHMSLDGFAAGPNGELDWVVYDEALKRYSQGIVDSVGTALYGRVTYEMMGYWRTIPDNPASSEHERAHAAWIEEIPKVVVSTTLDTVDWKNTSLISDELTAKIAQLKQQPGKDIVLFGSPSLTVALGELDLIDEYQLTLNPVLLRAGHPFFAQLAEKQRLQLLASQVLDSGVIGLHYQVLRA